MPATFDLVTIDTPRPDVLAAFWAQVLGLVESEREDGDRWIVLSEPDGRRRLGFQRGASGAGGGVHLDLHCAVPEFAGELERLVQCGAVLVHPPRQEPYGYIANLVDPDGNPFDLCAYES